jgi:Dolichyl-phosphate-mannose-protein mannosyltransferase
VSDTSFESPRLRTCLLFGFLFAGLAALHAGLLRLPYFWDEAGYYVPAARDLLLTGSLIPHSTPSNAHPPLVMAYLALCWKIAGYAPIVTRVSMLLIAAFSLLGVFRLAQRVANNEVAVASALCTALYPVFFAESSLAQVDLAAAGLTFWAWLAYVEDRRMMAVIWFSLAALAKETAILVPAALLLWECFAGMLPAVAKTSHAPQTIAGRRLSFPSKRTFLLLVPALPLALWYAYHRMRTGYIFGNPEFFRYNAQATIHPLRILLAFLLRLWQVVGYMNLYPLTLAALAAMCLPAQRDQGADKSEARLRIALDIQFAFLAVIVTYLLAMSVIGGAVLARYLLPAVPLVIIVCVSTLWRRVRWWRPVVGLALAAFVVALFVNPPYGFSPEDNLAYRDYILLHQRAEIFLEARYPMARVLTAWPASGELSQPFLGYVTRPMRVLQIENFTVEELASAADLKANFDVALVFSTKYEPPHPVLEHWRTWERIKAEYFGYHRDLPPPAAAQILGGRLVYLESRKGQWVGVIEMQQVVEARSRQIALNAP